MVPNWVYMHSSSNPAAISPGGLMKTGRLLLGGLLGAIALSACQKKFDGQLANSNENASIIGGTLVEKESYLAQSTVAILSAHMDGDKEVTAICTGSLLPGNFVVTAAHCMDDMMVVVFDKAVTDKSVMLPVDHASVHPLWRTHQQHLQRLQLLEDSKQPISEEDMNLVTRNNGDIAVIHFAGKAPENYVPATILRKANALQNGGEVVLAGFGITDGIAKSGEGTLLETKVQIADAKFTETEVKLDQTQGKGACHGDSGGPAYVNLGGRMYLWGVTSRGVDDEQDTCGKFSAYTSILPYTKWLITSMKLMTKDLKAAAEQKQAVAQN